MTQTPTLPPADSPADEDTLSRTQLAARAAAPTPDRSGRAARLRRWWRRRPVRRALVLIHRWPSLILGLLLIAETTSGALLLYRGEIFRATHGSLYQATATANPISPEQAIAAVQKEAPGYGAAWAARENGIWAVGNADYDDVYAVDPGTGHVNGHAKTDAGFFGFLGNLHDCALSCEGYPGYVSWLGTNVPTLGLTFLTDITWAGFILGVLGLLLMLLVVTGIATWWPGRKKIGHGFRVRTGKGRFARDYDLHNVVGLASLAFLLMWGVTGAAFEFPVVGKAWIAITGGEQLPEQDFAIEPNPAPENAPLIGTAAALGAALAKIPGEATFIGVPTEDAPWYEIDIVTSYGSYRHRALYPGDGYVLVDPHDAGHVQVIDGAAGPLANRFYDKYLEPTHFGWNVNAWWRSIWFVLGLAPLLLAWTAVSTWLWRRGVRKRRKRARAAPAESAPA